MSSCCRSFPTPAEANQEHACYGRADNGPVNAWCSGYACIACRNVSSSSVVPCSPPVAGMSILQALAHGILPGLHRQVLNAFDAVNAAGSPSLACKLDPFVESVIHRIH